MSQIEGSTCIVTGATSGIGRVAALQLAQAGARVILVGRSEEKARQTMVEIIRAAGHSNVEMLLADLSDIAQVRDLGARIRERFPHIDVLINNAGALNQEYRATADGLEMTFAVNHLAYFHLTRLLLDTLRASAPARVINVSSAAHRGARLDMGDLQLEKKYSGWRAYCNSKLANLLFTYELARRLDGTGVTVNAMHPGTVGTGFGRNNPGFTRRLMTMGRPFLRTPEKGARTLFYLATSSEVEGTSGHYFVDDRPQKTTAASHDAELAAALWEVSENLCGLD